MSLDILRGITVFAMILVNNAGGPDSYSQLQHSAWNGLTVCDLVFPFFLFIMGMSTYLSLRKTGFIASASVVRKILKRTFIILLICWALHLFDNVYSGKNLLDFAHLRLTGVLTRIALCYCIVSLLALCISRKALIGVAVALLFIYGALLVCFNGYINDLCNINTIVDRFLLPEGMLYTKKPVDPEGLLGTLPAIAHTIIGFCCGAIICCRQPLGVRIKKLSVLGFFLIAIGVCVAVFLPINKRIWSPSYVLVTCGIAILLLVVLIYFIDIKNCRKPFRYFEAFGVNPLFLYVLAEALAPVIDETGIKDSYYTGLAAHIPSPEFASLIYSLTLLAVVSVPALILWRKRVYIKI